MLDHENHRKHSEYIKDINRIYLRHPALWDNDTDWSGFGWIDAENDDQQIFSYIRKSAETGETLVIIFNAGADAYENYRIGVPEPGEYEEIINSDDRKYAGSGWINDVPVTAEDRPSHGMRYSIVIKVPPLGGCILKCLL